MQDKSDIMFSNHRLKAQLEAAQQEITLIKSSRGYKLVRLLGYVKKQLKQSPVGFSRKVIKKLLTNGKDGLRSVGILTIIFLLLITYRVSTMIGYCSTNQMV